LLTVRQGLSSRMNPFVPRNSNSNALALVRPVPYLLN
jgi:hypothetical protein